MPVTFESLQQSNKILKAQLRKLQNEKNQSGSFIHAQMESLAEERKGEILTLQEAQQKLAEQEHQFRSLFETSYNAIMTIAPPMWGFKRGNPAAIKMFGCSSEEDLINATPSQLSPEYQPNGETSADLAKYHIEHALIEGDHEFEWIHQRLNGDTFPAIVRLVRMEVDENETLNATIIDISSEVEAKKAQQRAEKQEQYTAFQAGIAEMGASVLHNIGNVITGMSGQILSLRNKFERLAKLEIILERYAEKIEASQVERAPLIAEMVKFLNGAKGVLAQARGNSGINRDELERMQNGIAHIGEIISIQRSAARPIINATEFNLDAMVDDTVNLIKDRFNKSKVLFEYHDELKSSSLYLPRNPLIQMLLNLLKNSLEAILEEMERGTIKQGKIKLTAKDVSKTEFMIVVEDNGCGASAENLKKMFYVGFTTKQKGSGYGLHSASNFIHSLGGEINTDSQGVGKGLKIEITLPYRANKQELA